jgi:Ser/Thr protein kinase RdoA (MazF antagonist)
MLPVLRSLPDPDALATHLGHLYGIEFTGCTLLRSLVNDVYDATAANGRYVVKLYRSGGWASAEIRWETGLSAHLSAAGLPVPPIVALPGGELTGVLDAPEGPRPFTVSAFVDGTKPQPPFDDELYRDFGVLVARFHEAADSYSPDFPRRPDDLAHRLDEPLAQILPLVGRAEENLLRALADAVRNNVGQYSDALDNGVCHGDVTLDNVVVTGWAAAELAALHQAADDLL